MSLIEECVVGCKKIDNGFVIAKNRDRVYSPSVSIVHKVSQDAEYVILYDYDTNYMEGYNGHTRIGILNSALENGTDFNKEKSDEGKNILRALMQAKTPSQAANLMCEPNHEVYGNTIIISENNAVLLEFDKRGKPKILDVTKKKTPTVRTNHSIELLGGGFSLDDDYMDYISSVTRKAVGEVMFSQGATIEKILDGLNYKLFGNHTAYDAHRNLSSYKTRSQIAIDPGSNKFYFRPIPGRSKFKGVKTINNDKIKPVIDVIILDYKEPTNAPFQSWSAVSPQQKINETNLVRLLDPDDDFSEMEGLDDIEQARIQNNDTKDSLDYYINRENEIITNLVSLQNLMKNRDTAMMHLMGDRNVEAEYEKICDLIDDFEKNVLDLYSISDANSKQEDKNKKSSNQIKEDTKKIKKMILNFKLADLVESRIEVKDEIFFAIENLI